MSDEPKCPVCEGVGSYMLRIGVMTRVKCMRCMGSGRFTETHDEWDQKISDAAKRMGEASRAGKIPKTL